MRGAPNRWLQRRIIEKYLLARGVCRGVIACRVRTSLHNLAASIRRSAVSFKGCGRAPARDFNSSDGHLTFAIVTHTAGNGFFDPVYVGATVAGNLIGAKILLLGSESPVDDPAREIEILNQIVQDPTIDGIIMTTPQAGAYDDIVKTAEKNGIPVATTNSFDGGIYHRLDISHTGQDASAAALPARRWSNAWRTRVSRRARSSCRRRPQWGTSR